MDWRCKTRLLSAALLAGASAHLATADVVTNSSGVLSGPVTLTGSLADETQVLEDSFTLPSSAAFTAFTTSYGGGTNSDGTTTTSGGFQPNLTLYKSDGTYVASQQVAAPGAATDTATGLALDGYLAQNALSAGDYILVLTDWANQQPPTATNLSDGFQSYGGSGFVDEMLNARSGDYTLNLAGSPVPEPGTLTMALLPVALLLLGAVRKKRKDCSALPLQS